MKILTARYVLPLTSEPIIDGAIAVEGSAIRDVGTRESLCKTFPEARVDDFGEAAIMPGFVNCHSHLEITAMRGALDRFEHSFYEWLITLTKLRDVVLSEDDIHFSALAGAVEGARSGVTCFGDIGRVGTAGFKALKTVGLRGVLFQETDFSADGRTAAEDFQKLQKKYLALKSDETDLVEVGISPHAPYTVSRELFERIAKFALDEKIKVTVHAAESREEDDLMRKGTGFFITVYEKFGVDWNSPLCSSIEFLLNTGILETRPLLAHCVTVSGPDIDIIAANRASVAHCPKSNAKFGHGYAPFEKLTDAGVAVGLGSDSVASNNSCDLLEEARFASFAARNRVDGSRFVSAKEVLDAATIGGARALGYDNQIGSLVTGKQADITVISLADISQQPVTDVYAALIFSSNARDVSMTMVGGREIYRDGQCTLVDEQRLCHQIAEIGKKAQNAQT